MNEINQYKKTFEYFCYYTQTLNMLKRHLPVMNDSNIILEGVSSIEVEIACL